MGRFKGEQEREKKERRLRCALADFGRPVEGAVIPGNRRATELYDAAAALVGPEVSTGPTVRRSQAYYGPYLTFSSPYVLPREGVLINPSEDLVMQATLYNGQGHFIREHLVAPGARLVMPEPVLYDRWRLSWQQQQPKTSCEQRGYCEIPSFSFAAAAEQRGITCLTCGKALTVKVQR